MNNKNQAMFCQSFWPTKKTLMAVKHTTPAQHQDLLLRYFQTQYNKLLPFP